MDIYLSFNNFAEILRLPVLPSEIEISTGLKNSTFEVINLGEIGIVGNRKLNSVSISSFFPKHYSSYCQYRAIPEPYVAVQRIERWKDSKRPIRLTITNIPLSMPCMIEDFNYKEKGGQPGDVYYTLSLKEYRFIQPKVIIESSEDGKPQVSKNSNRPVDRPTPSTYTVQKGDCLYTIAKKMYGNGEKYKELYEKNKATIGKDPNLIKPGQVFTL